RGRRLHAEQPGGPAHRLGAWLARRWPAGEQARSACMSPPALREQATTDRSMKLLLYAMIGGALGSGARHLTNIGMGRWLGPGFPWWTFSVNVLGCGLM